MKDNVAKYLCKFDTFAMKLVFLPFKGTQVYEDIINDTASRKKYTTRLDLTILAFGVITLPLQWMWIMVFRMMLYITNTPFRFHRSHVGHGKIYCPLIRRGD